MGRADFFNSLLLPEKEIKNKAQDYAYEYGRGDGKIDCEVFLFVIQVARKTADVWYFLAESEDNADDNDCYAYYNEKFADGLKGFHEGILPRGMERVKGAYACLSQHLLYFLPEPQGQRALLLISRPPAFRLTKSILPIDGFR